MRDILDVKQTQVHPSNTAKGWLRRPSSSEIDALNGEMVAAGARQFVGGLSPANRARWLRAQPNGKVLVTDGPYTETKEP